MFLQADCILGESGNLTIYGHNMNSGAMFGNLDQYSSYESVSYTHLNTRHTIGSLLSSSTFTKNGSMAFKFSGTVLSSTT